MATSDEELALAAASGDAAAFSKLLERRYDSLFALCFRLTGSRAEAEDLTQDISAALPAKLAGFRGDARFATWLYRVAVNAAHDRRRRSAAHAKAAAGWGDRELDRRATDAEAADKVRWLRQAMRALPNDLRDTLALVLDELTPCRRRTSSGRLRRHDQLAGIGGQEDHSRPSARSRTGHERR